MTPPDLTLSLPYITHGLPGIGGTLRATPESFVVEEIPLYAASGEGTHLYINLTRSEMTTRDVAIVIARTLALRDGEIGYAGLKDKYARTTQTFSVPVRQNMSQAELDDMVGRIANAIPSEKHVQVNWHRLHGNKLRTGHLQGNRFAIIVGKIDLPASEALARAEAIAAAMQHSGVPNFLGAQRFGAHGDNAIAGYELVKRKRRVQDRWLRRFLVTSYQSHLCNLYLARRVEAGDFGRVFAGDVAKKYATGGLFVVEDVAAEQERYLAREISFTAPVFGFKMKRAQGDAAALEAQIEAETGITDAQWRAAHSEGTRRMGRLLLDDLSVDAHDQGIRVSFTLPKGAFATTILREFMKGEGDSLPPQEIDEQSE